jgi:tetratricopeptide (TPR) repeat protein
VIVLMLEDVHWADDMSLRLLAFLARRIPSWPVLLVASSREEELAEAATVRRILEELGREAHVMRVTLAPLSRPDTMDLVRSLARAGSEAGALARLEEQVWTVSEGNPFVAVETMRAVQDGTIPSASALPERVRAMIASRLDRLTESARQLAAMAAVIGREFEFPLLQRASGLDETSAAEGVEELVRRRVLQGVGERFDFIHHRLQSAVYDRLLPPRRKLLHRRAGEALEALSSGDLERDPLALGLHFREGEVWDKAAGYLRAAGVDAIARSAYREAAACLEQALAIARRLPETRVRLEQEIDLRLDLRASLHAMGEVVSGFEHLRDAERLARALDDQRRLGFASVYLAHYHWLKLRLTDARSFAQTALAIGEALADFRLTVAASFYLGMTCASSGDYRAAGDFYEMGLRALGDDRGRERCGLMGFPAVLLRARLAQTLAERGEFRRGLALAQEALQIAETLEHPYSLLSACFGLGFLYGAKGDLTQAASLLERGLALADRWNIPAWVPTLSEPLGQVYALLGRCTEAISMLRSTIPRFETKYGRSTPQGMRNLGEALLRAGQLDAALSLGGQALAAGRANGQRGIEARGLLLIAEIAAHRDPPDAAESEKSYREALALAEQLGMQPLAARCRLGLGELYSRTGEPEKATTELTGAARLFRSMDMTFWLDRAENAHA